MTRRNFTLSAMLLAGAAMLSPALLHADEMTDLKARFKERFAQVLALQDAGTVGETWDGWVAGVKGELAGEQKALIDAENADRAKLYELIAGKSGAKASDVGERNGLRNFKTAAAEHWLKLKTGQWKQKKDVKLEG